jgi:uncharacterized membrane protein (UPF0127 family)
MTRWLAALLLLIATPAYALPTIQTIISTERADRTLTLELATTPSTREYGLMNRKTLAPNDGMLFVFPSITAQLFWMKNTLIPLDMLFLDTTHHIVYIATGTPLSETPIGLPQQPVAAVIELDGGRAAKDGIAVGDKVTYALPANTAIE